jgi:hypothetical protein
MEWRTIYQVLPVTDTVRLIWWTCNHATTAKIVGMMRLSGTKQGHPPSITMIPSVLNQRNVSRPNKISVAGKVMSVIWRRKPQRMTILRARGGQVQRLVRPIFAVQLLRDYSQMSAGVRAYTTSSASVPSG